MTKLIKIKWLYSFLLFFVFLNTNGQDNINPEKKGYNYEKAWSGGIKLRTDDWERNRIGDKDRPNIIFYVGDRIKGYGWGELKITKEVWFIKLIWVNTNIPK